jgi:bifunctional non-homologous end joining protein LigD
VILDGEIVLLDKHGKSQFYSLMFRRGPARFYAFDVIELNGRDSRSLPLLKRKELLKRLIPARNFCLLDVDHVEGKGALMVQPLSCARALQITDIQRELQFTELRMPPNGATRHEPA